MDGNGFPDQEQLLQFLKKLKEVFDVCDEDDDGYIRVEHFIDLGLQFGQGDEVQKLTKYLDPNELGRINFKDFCHGVFAIKGCEEILKNALGARSAPCRPYEAEYEEYNYQQGEEVLGRPYVVCDRAYGECEIFPPDEDGMTLLQRDGHRESDMDSAIGSTHSSEASDLCRGEDKEEGLGGLFLPTDKSIPHNPSAASDLSTRSTASLISNEEQFEDYGEGEDVDYTPSSPCPDDETRTNGFSDLGSSVSSSAGQTPRKMRHAYNNDMLDVYCSQCCKKINLLNDLEARLKNLKANSPNRKITSTAFGRQLFHNSNFSSSNGSTEDLFRDSIDSCENDITEKVSSLEKKVTELENDSSLNGDLKGKLKQENTQLVHRVHELEEQIKDQEARAEQVLEEEIKRHREAYVKMEREKSTEIELLNNRVQQLEDENGEMGSSVNRLKSQTEKLDEERQRMTYKLEDTSLRLKDEMDLYKKMMDKLRQNRHEFQKEREATQELIEDLRKELEHLQLFKLETERPSRGRSSSSSLSEFNAKTREMELEHEIKRLKQENQKLREQNDDLNGQILSLSLYEAKNLFATHTKAQSLAAEIDNASRDENLGISDTPQCRRSFFFQAGGPCRLFCTEMKPVVDAVWAVWSIGASIYDYIHTTAMEERIHQLETVITVHQFVIVALTAGLILLVSYIVLRKQ
ncbi:Rab11 family-interacting protein 4A [Acipenser ruthenus]|uniref:Rab11 family-interacting protein 4A n=1 Tax=Acipenser ruthenus TaxID=7906 RepID=A0A662YVL6_ACIRT|nr:Rab11 family-interacting protein 4A [Acipenser ruthenus]